MGSHLLHSRIQTELQIPCALLVRFVVASNWPQLGLDNFHCSFLCLSLNRFDVHRVPDVWQTSVRGSNDYNFWTYMDLEVDWIIVIVIHNEIVG